ncbi:MAG: AEC family transporter [Planctomycetia bacterium]|nr:AEC family transporter [Planctomycetia bacterium]
MVESVFNASLSVFVLILAGGFLRYIRCLRQEADASLMSLCINVLYPCLIFDRISRTDILSHLDTMWAAPIAGFLSVSVALGCGYLFTWLPGRFTLLGSLEERRTFAMATAVSNYGYLPIPILLLLYPNDPEVMSMLFVYTLGVELAVWTCAVPYLGGGFHKGWWKNMITTPFLTILAAVALNLLGVVPYLPEFLSKSIEWVGLGQICIPLLVIGAIIFDELVKSKEFWRWATLGNVFWIHFFRSGIVPAMMVFMAMNLPQFPLLQKILVIQAAMPTGMILVMFSRLYGGSPATAVKAVLATNLLAPVTSVFWIALGMRLIQG